MDELAARAPAQDVVFISDDKPSAGLDRLLDNLRMQTGYLPVALFSSPLHRKLLSRRCPVAPLTILLSLAPPTTWSPRFFEFVILVNATRG